VRGALGRSRQELLPTFVVLDLLSLPLFNKFVFYVLRSGNLWIEKELTMQVEILLRNYYISSFYAFSE
jgi:hypothetical protein